MKPSSKPSERDNATKPLLADLLKLSRHSLIRMFQDNGFRVFEIYYTMSKARLAEKLTVEFDSKNIS